MTVEHSNIDYSERIPNNVGLAGNRRLQRALESWQPNYIKWWQELRRPKILLSMVSGPTT